eukprot:3933732-Amphidinium_carterae.1
MEVERICIALLCKKFWGGGESAARLMRRLGAKNLPLAQTYPQAMIATPKVHVVSIALLSKSRAHSNTTLKPRQK